MMCSYPKPSGCGTATQGLVRQIQMPRNLPRRTSSAGIPCARASAGIPPAQTPAQTAPGCRTQPGHAAAPSASPGSPALPLVRPSLFWLIIGHTASLLRSYWLDLAPRPVISKIQFLGQLNVLRRSYWLSPVCPGLSLVTL
jgi:hypothetical protein